MPFLRTTKVPGSILLNRTDSIGDAVLTLPMAACLKQRFPDARLVYLGRALTRDVIAAAPVYDGFLDWDVLRALPPAEAAARVRAEGFDAAVHVQPRKPVARLLADARIPLRIGTLRRLYHLWTCNRWVNLSRKRSRRHQAEMNLELLAPFGIGSELGLGALAERMRLVPSVELPVQIAADLERAGGSLPVVLHPGSQGTSREWPIEHYAALARSLSAAGRKVIFTGSPAEAERFRPALRPLFGPDGPALDLLGALSLAQLIALIARSEALVSASTGPLHLAAALGVRALGLYSPHPRYHPPRWGPLGPRAEVLLTDRTCPACVVEPRCDCMAQLLPEVVARTLLAPFERPWFAA